MKLDLSRLVNVKKQPDQSVICQCPQCAIEGQDRTGRNHLRVYVNGAFNCVLHGDDRVHNAQIRALLRGTASDDNPDEVYIDTEPKVSAERIYPEESLARLLPDYSYWIGRGADPEVIKRLEGGLAPADEKSKLAGRFIFPIRGLDGRITGFTGRLVQPNSFAPSWKHLFKSSKAVYPWHVSGAHIKETKTCVLVESIGDYLALASHGIEPVLCLFGLNLNGKIISSLVGANVNRIIVSLNRDEDESKGQRAAEVIRNRLCAFFAEDHVSVRLPPVGVKDWGACPTDEIAAFRTEVLI